MLLYRLACTKTYTHRQLQNHYHYFSHTRWIPSLSRKTDAIHHTLTASSMPVCVCVLRESVWRVPIYSTAVQPETGPNSQTAKSKDSPALKHTTSIISPLLCSIHVLPSMCLRTFPQSLLFIWIPTRNNTPLGDIAGGRYLVIRSAGHTFSTISERFP